MSDVNVKISIILGTNRPQNIKDFITNLESKTNNPRQVEILVSVDKDDHPTISELELAKSYSKFNIRYFEDIRQRGYFEANKQYNKLLLEASETSVFFSVFSDKLKIKTFGWDDLLLKYYDVFEDGVIRVRITKFKNVRSYENVDSSLKQPDNFSFHSRKLVELMRGWGDYWGPDSWTEAVMYMLEVHSKPDLDLFRNVVAHDISTEEYFYTSDKKQTDDYQIRLSCQRAEMISWAFNFMSTDISALENFYRISVMIELYIINWGKLKNTTFEFVCDSKKRIIGLVSSNGDIISEKTYCLPSKTLFFLNSEYYVTSKISPEKLNRKYRSTYKKYLLLFRVSRSIFKILYKIVFQNFTKNGDDIRIIYKKGAMVIEENSFIENSINQKYRELFHN